MRLLQVLAKTQAFFDDPHLMSRAVLVPVMALAQRVGRQDLARGHVRIDHPCGVNAEVQIGCLVAGMTSGADLIDDMDVLRHGAMPDVFGGIRAPSTLGSQLRSYSWGTSASWSASTGSCSPSWPAGRRCCPGKDVLAFIDIDAMQKRVYGHHEQGAAFGHTKIQAKSLLVRGLNTLAATICTPF